MSRTPAEIAALCCRARVALAADRGSLLPASPLSVECPRCTQRIGICCDEVDTRPVDMDKVMAAWIEMRRKAGGW